MGGWKMIYALINFAVIATALFFVGRKIVLKGYKAYREKIRASLDGGVNAVKEAQEIKESFPALSETGKAESEAILRRADDRAEEMRRQARAEKEAAQAADASKIAAEREKAIEEIRAGMNGYASDVICDKTAQLLQSGDFAEKKQQYTEKICRELAEKLQPTAGERSAVRAGASLDAVVEYAAEPDAALCARIEGVLRDQYGGDGLTIRSCVNSTLLCGVKVTVGDSVYDGSIKSAVDRARKHIASYEGGVEDAIACADTGMDIYQVGCVEKLSDGICQVTGLSDAMSGELLEFESGQQGMVMDLEKDHVGVAVFDHYDSIHQGAAVRRTGRVIQVPVGEALIGRVVDALGRPLDGKGEIIASAYRPVESPAPGVIARKSVNQPLETGIKAIDMLVPIGRGQRELIIGDRQTGKTSIALDTIINQRGKDVICVYVAIGQKESTVADIVDRLEQYDAMSYTTVVCANASESAPMLYIAPYAGAAMGEYFMYSGRDVLIVYDDLSKHAVAYREISLLLHRPPGREAYPGDVFYLHSRLLERAAKLNDEYGGGSMTALPIIETQAGDISAYIPTNVISITDGQIFLETELFNAGVRPAINAGLSVSRVGGAAQPTALKRFAGRLRVDLAQYRELAAFSQFGSDLDKDTKAALARGERMTQLLKQPRFEPRSATEQVIAAFAMNEGAADSVPVEEIHRFEKDLLAWVQDSLPELDAAVRSGQKLDEELTEKLRGAVRAFPRQ